MKIAIPTEDGLTIGSYKPDSSFLILTLEFGEIINQEMKKNHLDGKLNTDNKPDTRLDDCSVIIARELGAATDMHKSAKEIIITKEPFITSAIIQYLESEYTKTSNVCCCP